MSKHTCMIHDHEASAVAPKMLEALDWYAEMARQMQRATLHMDNQTMLHLMKELALDGGRRANQARAAIAKAEGL